MFFGGEIDGEEAAGVVLGGFPADLAAEAGFVASGLSILSRLLPGHMVSDVVAVLGSLDFVMGECDR
jgi:NADH-quinone oxidoreductase subunit D